jgi:hypothetical protein
MSIRHLETMPRIVRWISAARSLSHARFCRTAYFVGCLFLRTGLDQYARTVWLFVMSSGERLALALRVLSIKV